MCFNRIDKHTSRIHVLLIYYKLIYIWVRSRNCGCLVTCFCYQLIAKPGNKTAAVSWPDPYDITRWWLSRKCWVRMADNQSNQTNAYYLPRWHSFTIRFGIESPLSKAIFAQPETQSSGNTRRNSIWNVQVRFYSTPTHSISGILTILLLLYQQVYQKVWDRIPYPFPNINGAAHTLLGIPLLIHAENKVNPC